MFRAMFSPIVRSTWLYLQYLVVFTQVAVGWCPEWVETAYVRISLFILQGEPSTPEVFQKVFYTVVVFNWIYK